MDPIHPIIPVTPGVSQITPSAPTRRVDPDPRRDRGRDARREPPRERRQPDGDTPDGAPHVDISA